MYRLLRPLFFQIDAERAHHQVTSLLDLALDSRATRRAVAAAMRIDAPELRRHVFGLSFDNPVGLAAGFDKNAEHLNPLGALGFSHVEIGTVTGQAQPGNPKPRLFRLPADRALLNRMGFNNEGSEAVAARLGRTEIEPLLGVNIGKTKVVANEEAADDYALSFERLFDFARYFVVNVSSPNTPGLRELQDRAPLSALLSRLQELNGRLGEERGGGRRPLLVKIAPDLSWPQIDDALEVIEECGLDGIVATNTTISREGLRTPGHADLGAGGISGKPVQARSLEVIRYIHRHTEGSLPIVGVGGIFTADDALAAMRAGASLVQVWTGFVYEGPTMVRRINRGLLEACRREGWSSLDEAIGLDA